MNNPKRKYTRLKDFNYSQSGVYFVTLCTLNRQNILSTISVGGGVLDAPSVELFDYGKIADTVISNINQTYDNIQISKYVIMTWKQPLRKDLQDPLFPEAGMWGS